VDFFIAAKAPPSRARQNGTIRPLALALAGSALLSGAALALPHGRPGECWEEVRGRAVYKTVTETAPQSPLVSYRRVPAVYASETRTIVVRPAHVVYDLQPAVFRTVARTRTVEGPPRRVLTPAVFKVVQERQLIEPAHLAWRRGAAARPGADDGALGVTATPTGEVLCRVLVPARYALIRRRVMVAPEGARLVKGPARRVICYQRVLERPCRRIPRTVPAVTRTVVVRRLVKPATCLKIVTARPPKTVRRLVRVGTGPSSWRRLGCGRRNDAPAPAATQAPPAPAPAPSPSPAARP
jgi:hypothetical protein